MKKIEFEKELSQRLANLPKEERQKALEYYDELFCDRKERGEEEETIIESFGSPEDIAARIFGETVFTKTTRKVKSTILRIFTNKSFLIFYFSAFIITFPLTIAAFSIALGIGITIFSVIIAFGAVALACGIAGPLYLILGPISAGGFNPAGLALFGCGATLIAIGIAFFMLLKTLDYLRILIFVKTENKSKAYKHVNKGNIFLKLTVIACILFVAGGSIFTVGFATADWNIRSLDTAEYTSVSTALNENIDKVTIRTTSREITIVQVTDNFRIEGYSDNESKLTVSTVGNELIVKEKYKFEFMQVFNTFKGVNWKKNRIKIYLPAEITEIDAKLSSGDISVSGITAQKATVKVTSGDTYFTNCNIKYISIEANSGDVRTTALRGESISIKTTSGDIDARLAVNPENYDIKSSVKSGDNYAKKHTRLDTNAAENGFKINLRASSGDIRLKFTN